jgi:sugar lactone lactonase YvrE
MGKFFLPAFAVLVVGPALRADIIYISDATASAGAVYASKGSSTTTFASGLCSGSLGHCFPLGLALDSAGDLFVADGSAGDVFEFSPSGVKTVAASGLTEPFGLAFNQSGTLFIADDESGSIYQLTSSGLSVYGQELAFPTGIAVDGAGNVYVSVLGAPTSSTSGVIYKYTSQGQRTVFASGLDRPGGLAFNSAGDLFEADFGSGRILEFTPAGAKSTFASGLNTPVDVAFDSQGNLYATDPGSNSVFEFTPGGSRSLFATEPLPTFLAIYPGPGIPIIANPEPRYLLPLAGCLVALIIQVKRRQKQTSTREA